MSQLDKLAHGIAQARTAGQFAHLETQENAFVEHLLDLAPDLDQQAVGAAWLILGQLIATGITQHPEHLQLQAVGNLLNAARLAGQRLYSGAELVHPCPIPRSNGTACRFTAKGARQEVLDAMMRAHVEVYHPGQSWPPQPEASGLDDEAAFEATLASYPEAVGPLKCASCGRSDSDETPLDFALPDGAGRLCQKCAVPVIESTRALIEWDERRRARAAERVADGA